MILISFKRVPVSFYATNGRLIPNSKLLVECEEDDCAVDLKRKAFNKQCDYNPHLVDSMSSDIWDYKLIYRSGVEVEYIPGSNQPFKLSTYKDGVGVPYQSLLFGLQFKGNETAGNYSILLCI